MIHQGEADVAVPVRNATTRRDCVSASAARDVLIYNGVPHMLDDGDLQRVRFDAQRSRSA